MTDQIPLQDLLSDIRACNICEDLPLGARPVLQASKEARILIAGQAPGKKVHQSGVPFDDASGKRLRDWMGISVDQFYDPKLIAILPMGFCYPGKGSSGDLPPRKECAATWRASLLAQLPNIALTIVVGRHALNYHLPEERRPLTEVVQASVSAPDQDLLVMPHPSPRNNIWLKKHPWFEQQFIPQFRQHVATILQIF